MIESLQKINTIVTTIDADPVSREIISLVLGGIGHTVYTYENCNELKDNLITNHPNCLILDSTEFKNIEFINLFFINSNQPIPPCIYISEDDDLKLAIQTIKDGAIDFFIKPVNATLLIDAVNQALNKDFAVRKEILRNQIITNKFLNLSKRENEVLKGIMSGIPNKNIAMELEISLKTVEAHRASLMKKMGVRSVSEIVKLYYSLN